jgi:hypothetical protein
MAHPCGPGAMPLCAALNHGYMFQPIRVTPHCAGERSQEGFALLPLGRTLGRPRRRHGRGAGTRGPAAERLRLVECWPADQQSACRRPSFEGGFPLFPSVPCFSSVTVFATVAGPRRAARVRFASFARCSPGPFAALRAAASAPALATRRKPAPLVAR